MILRPRSRRGRYRCRRANSAISRPAAIASTPNCCSQVPGLIACTVRSNASVWAVWKVSATHPDALFTRMSTGPRYSSAASNNASRRRRVGQVGLLGQGPSAPGLDLVGHRGTVARPAVPGRPGETPGRLVVHPQERAQHGTAARGERRRGRRADAVVGAGDHRRMTARRPAGHDAASWSRRIAAPPWPGRPSAAADRSLLRRPLPTRLTPGLRLAGACPGPP